MENNPVSKYTVSFGLSLVVSSVINALLVVAKEKSPAVQAGMQRLTGHHWTTHSVVVVVCFLFLGWLLAQVNGGRGVTLTVNLLIKIIVAGLLVAGAIIAGFYLMAD
jgi:hypothetical protein